MCSGPVGDDDHRECCLAPFSLLDVVGRAISPAGRGSEPEGRASEPAGRALDTIGASEQATVEEPLRKVQRWENLGSS